MKTFAKIAVLGAALAVAPLAFATPIVNGFGVTGSDNDALAPYVGGSITFAGPGGEQTSTVGGGEFAGLPVATTINFVTGFYLDSIPMTGEELFEFSAGGTSYTFSVMSYALAVKTGVIYLYGIMDATGAQNYSISGEFTMANNNGMIGPYDMEPFTGTFELLPEPNNLLLLGTGLLMACAIMAKKRRIV